MIQKHPIKRLITVVFTISLILFFLSGTTIAQETKYTCPMHPHYISDTFGACPICGMDLVEVATDEADSGEHEDHGLFLPTTMIQQTGVRSKPVETAYFGRSLRSYGEVAANQRLQTDISLRVEGWIEELIVNAEGDEVEIGSLLFKFYSPQLVSAQQDYLTALSSGATGRITVSKDRLQSLGVQKKVINQLKTSRKVIRNIPYYAEQRGRIEEIGIRQGSYLRPGAIAMRIQNYDKVWIQVNLAEQDISFVKQDSRVDVDFPNLSIKKENVTIDYIAPTVDPSTRTAQMRLVLENTEGEIRPGAYVDVTIMTDIAPRLAIPYESVLLNKEGAYVIIDRNDGTFQAREIKTGIQYSGVVEVQAGLKEGDLVVTSGQFLIDSESSLRESFQRMEKLALSLAQLELTENQLSLLNHLVEGILYIHEELTANRLPQPQVLDAAEQAAHKLEHELRETRLSFVVDDYLNTLKDRNKVITLSGWQTLLASLTEAVTPWVTEGKPLYYKDLGLTIFVTEDKRSWIQFAGDTMNPYGTATASEIKIDHKLQIPETKESDYAQ